MARGQKPQPAGLDKHFDISQIYTSLSAVYDHLEIIYDHVVTQLLWNTMLKSGFLITEKH
jgi:hypothetical protein